MVVLKIGITLARFVENPPFSSVNGVESISVGSITLSMCLVHRHLDAYLGSGNSVLVSGGKDLSWLVGRFAQVTRRSFSGIKKGGLLEF